MNVSSTNLFHFTSRVEWLIGILNNGFYPRYCLEDYFLESTTIQRAYPMVCFCDIPLSLISDHINSYGSYGIGLTKDWAIKNGLNPILYLNKDSTFKNILDNLSIHYKTLEKFKPEVETDEMNLKEKIAKGKFGLDYLNMQVELAQTLLRMQRFIKPYSDSSNIYYNEREWRYCPDNKDIVLNYSEYSNKDILEQKHIQLSNKPLEFSENEITYIFVPTANDIELLINGIKSTKLKEKLKHKILNLNILKDI